MKTEDLLSILLLEEKYVFHHHLRMGVIAPFPPSYAANG
jgi:hypothetical protein